MAILETKNLSKAFGALAAVDDVSLAIEAGTLHSIIGPNGAGKTTFFNLLTGTYRPSAGRILFDGRDITGTPAHRVAHLGLARSFQRTNVFPAFSLLDNVWVAAFACGPRSEEHTSELQSHVNLVCRLLLEKKNQNHFCLRLDNKKIENKNE